MKASAAIVACGGDHKTALVVAVAYRVDQHRVGFAVAGQLTTADVDDVGTCVDGQVDRAGQIHLRDWPKIIVRIDRGDQSATKGRNARAPPPCCPKIMLAM